MKNMNKSVLALGVCSLLTACGGSSGGGATGGVGPKDFTLSGSVSGLTGTLDLINVSNQETVSIAGNSFAFTQKLANKEQYDINLASAADGQQLCEVIDGSGLVNAANVTDIEIVCRDWVAAATTLNSETAEARYPEIVRVDDALEVMWYESGVISFLQRRAYEAASGWEASSTLYTVFDSYLANSHTLVANSQGESMVAHIGAVPNRTGNYVWASDSIDLSSGNFTDIERTSDSYAMDIDEQGHVILVWVDTETSGEESIFYSYFDGTWGPEIELETNITGDARHPVVKFTGNGTAVAAWEFGEYPTDASSLKYDGVQVASFDASKAGNKWTADTAIDTADGGCGLVRENSINIEITDAGMPTVAWMQGDCVSGNVQHPLQISKLVQSTWSAPINISVNSSSSDAKIIALTADKIMATYNDGAKTYAQTCDLTTDTCSSATELSAEFRAIQSLAKDKNNNVMAAWIDGDDAYVNRYDVANDEWSVMSKINTDTVGNAKVAALDGDFVVTWSEYRDLSSASLSSLKMTPLAATTNRWTVFAKEFKAQ